MAIVINGSGTVTGLAVGGLPDDSVDAGSLANSINSEITANTAKTGITSAQATAITAALPKAGGTMTGAIVLGTNTVGGLQITTPATSNIGLGATSVDSITTGDYNVGLGDYSLTANTTGSDNAAIGDSAMERNTTGSNNVAVGRLALDHNTTASNNTAVGHSALTANTTGHTNTATGRSALLLNTTGPENVACGTFSLDANTTGASNTGVGAYSLSSNTTGGFNTGIGEAALLSNTTASYNTALGKDAARGNTTGQKNTAIGQRAMITATTGNENTCIGREAGSALTTGSNNLFLGQNAGDASSPSETQAGSNKIVLGNNNITHAYVKVDWTIQSDQRDKMNFASVPHGLSFVNSLQPYKFDFKKARDDATPHGGTKYGFKAQDVLALEGDNPVIINNEDTNSLKITNSHLIPVLVKAIQDLSAKVTVLENA